MGRLYTLDETVGRSSESHAEVRYKVSRAVREAAGYPFLLVGQDPLIELRRRVRRLMEKACGYENQAAEVLSRGRMGRRRPSAVDSKFEGPSPYMPPPHLIIPARWHETIRVERARGEPRAHLEAIHLLAYIVHMYWGDGRFPGDVLFLNRLAVSERLGLPAGLYRLALDFLASEGFITRIILRGQVPWEPRQRGVFTFAVPRLPKVRAATLPRRPKQGGD